MAACDPRWNERVSACLDGEAGLLARARVRRHLAVCAGCADAWARYGALRAALRRARRPEARLVAAPRRAPVTNSVLAAAAALLVIAGGGALAWRRVAADPHLGSGLATDAERVHLRAFARAAPCEYESSSPAAVADWTARTLGRRVDVPRIDGATLLGARRCALDGQPAAHLLYRIGDRALTVLVPVAGSSAEAAANRFARGAARCTEAPLGDGLCVVPSRDQTLVAVADLDTPRLLKLLRAAL